MITLLVAYVIDPHWSGTVSGLGYILALAADLGIVYALGRGIRDVLIAFANRNKPTVIKAPKTRDSFARDTPAFTYRSTTTKTKKGDSNVDPE